jgi:hypothetical protein
MTLGVEAVIAARRGASARRSGARSTAFRWREGTRLGYWHGGRPNLSRGVPFGPFGLQAIEDRRPLFFSVSYGQSR